ncbi:hypothetical protein SRIMR7_03850 [Streptomyces rimosus subsp. rimosus]|uniref:Uncharacterized protein n=1 Tax=Streptomyces rimosus subsp. rimosus TaxID=132474 RepID=A0ABY3YUC9_STRRM|nr:hypothetical protein SRIMR7_03850 [Streptomyces rimosus subsp. rimosus]
MTGQPPGNTARASRDVSPGTSPNPGPRNTADLHTHDVGPRDQVSGADEAVRRTFPTGSEQAGGASSYQVPSTQAPCRSKSVGPSHVTSDHSRVTNSTDTITPQRSDLDLRSPPEPTGRPWTASTTYAMWYRWPPVGVVPSSSDALAPAPSAHRPAGREWQGGSSPSPSVQRLPDQHDSTNPASPGLPGLTTPHIPPPGDWYQDPDHTRTNVPSASAASAKAAGQHPRERRTTSRRRICWSSRMRRPSA